MKFHSLITLCLFLLSTPLLGHSDKSWIEPFMGMKFLYIPAGTFTMGSPDTEKGRQQFAEKQHTTKVKAFWLAETEVTQAQWKKVMNTNPSHFKCKDRPVEKANWHDAHEFVRQLNDISKMLFQLPSEAE